MQPLFWICQKTTRSRTPSCSTGLLPLGQKQHRGKSRDNRFSDRPGSKSSTTRSRHPNEAANLLAEGSDKLQESKKQRSQKAILGIFRHRVYSAPFLTCTNPLTSLEADLKKATRKQPLPVDLASIQPSRRGSDPRKTILGNFRPLIYSAQFRTRTNPLTSKAEL